LRTYKELNQYRIEHHDDIKRYVWQVELTEEGLPHIQGYFELKPKKNWRYNRVKEWIGLGTKRAHITTGSELGGTALQNYNYCTKEDSRWMEGEQYGDWEDIEETPKKNGWSTIVERIRNGGQLRDLYDEFPRESLVYSKGINLAMENLQPPPKRMIPSDPEIQFVWIFGPSGSGKTKMVWDWAEQNNINLHIKGPTSKWWCGYDEKMHDAVLIDDYRDNKELPYDELLRLCDLTPIRVEPKGGSKLIRPKKVFITSNYAPWDMFRGVGEAYPQSGPLATGNGLTPLVRRLTQWGKCFICQKGDEERVWSQVDEIEKMNETDQVLTEFGGTEMVEDEQEPEEEETHVIPHDFEDDELWEWNNTQTTIPVATGSQENPIVIDE